MQDDPQLPPLVDGEQEDTERHLTDLFGPVVDPALAVYWLGGAENLPSYEDISTMECRMRDGKYTVVLHNPYSLSREDVVELFTLAQQKQADLEIIPSHWQYGNCCLYIVLSEFHIRDRFRQHMKADHGIDVPGV